MNITQPTLSHHMKILCDSDIIEGRKEGKGCFYGKGAENSRCRETSCPYIGREFNDNWGLIDPTNENDEFFIEIIKKIEQRILELKNKLS